VATSPVVHLLKADDPTLLADGLHALVAELSGGDPNAVEDIGGDDASVDAAVEAAQTPPFLAERRVVVLREVGRFRTEEVAPLVKYLEDPMPTTVLVLTGGGGQIPTSLLNAVKKAGHVQDVGAGTGKARTHWLADALKKAPVDLDRDARTLLGEHLGEDVGRLGTLLDALAAAYGEGANITSDLLAPFLGAAGAGAAATGQHPGDGAGGHAHGGGGAGDPRARPERRPPRADPPHRVREVDPGSDPGTAPRHGAPGAVGAHRHGGEASRVGAAEDHRRVQLLESGRR
jgi:hypothetical protein